MRTEFPTFKSDNHEQAKSHQSCMRFPSPYDVRLATLTFALATGAACAPNQSADQLKQKTAETTATIKRDTKAIAEGVKEGLSRKESVNLNKASKADLQGLPGITPQKADRIIAERPYADPHQLVTRHVLSEDEYAQVKDRVVVTQ
jgi:DNA uptake protein ComE-like DNA-binding protein